MLFRLLFMTFLDPKKPKLGSIQGAGGLRAQSCLFLGFELKTKSRFWGEMRLKTGGIGFSDGFGVLCRSLAGSWGFCFPR